MRKSDLDELAAAEIFALVARAPGFTRAAKVLGKNPSTLSRAVADLERHVGAQLLARTTRRLHLTEAGALYLTHVDGLLAARRAAHDAVAELTGGVPRGHLRVSMPVSVGERLLGPHLPSLRERYPELRLEIDLSDRNVPLVEGGFDLAIRVGRFADSSLRAQLLGKIPVRLVASPRYLARAGEPKRPHDLAQHACIVVGPVGGPQEWAFYRKDRPGTSTRVAIEGGLHTTSPTLAAQVAVAGVGIMRSTEWVIRDELRRGDLVEIMPSWSCDDATHGGVPVFVMYAQSAGIDPPLKSRVFVELVKRVMANEVLSPLVAPTPNEPGATRGRRPVAKPTRSRRAT